MKSSLIYIPAAQFISFTLHLIFFSGRSRTNSWPLLTESIWNEPEEWEKRGARTWMSLARFWTIFFQLPNWENIFCSLFPGGGWVGLFVFSGAGNFGRSSPLFQFGRAGAGAVSKWHAQQYKRALHLWSCFLVFPSILVCSNLKEAIELKGGTNNLQADKARESWERPNFHETLVFQFIFKCAPEQLDNLSSAGHSWAL